MAVTPRWLRDKRNPRPRGRGGMVYIPRESRNQERTPQWWLEHRHLWTTTMD